MKRLMWIALLWGCGADNAVLDGNVTLPELPAGTSELFTVVQVMRTTDFAVGWEGATLPETQELGSTPTMYLFSVVSENTRDDVRLKFRFCRDPDCQATACLPGVCGPTALRADPQAEIWVNLETPLYRGEFTSWNFAFPALPQCVGDDATCEETTAPSIPGCAIDRSVPYPVWSCTVPRCDIACPRTPGGIAGNCADGATGPHFCTLP